MPSHPVCISFNERTQEVSGRGPTMAGEAYRELGTTSEVTACQFCHRKRLHVTTVLEVHGDHGQIIGTAYACADCADNLTAVG